MRIVALALAMTMACGTAGKGSEMTTKTFDCAHAADLLGLSGSKVEVCKEVLPSVWHVGLTGGTLAPGWHELRRFRWVDGKVSTDKGMAALADALRDIKAADQATLDGYGVTVLLDVVEGAPPGFTGNMIDGDVEGVRGGVTTKPLTITLVSPSYDPHPADDEEGPGGPGGAPQPQVARATLSLDASYRGQWVVEVKHGDGAFENVATIPVAPTH